MSEEIVIIGGSNVLTASGGDGTENHLRYGAENDRVTLIQRTWRDIHDIFDDAERLGRQYAIRQFILAPYEDMSRDFMLTVALPILAKEFKFKPFECSIVEHEKGRADPGACRVGPASDHLRVAALAIDLRSQLSHRALSAFADFSL